ncbi:MAG: NADH:flavin oxidoreductase [Deltaproteobacteria bacterium]|nr:NADH:flavin oxidoreductase [Deltaproteobacteria bacterium]MBW2364877.1 NADH:flavin oxidoreductase [Deltaproteobacteria bacterium]
MTNNSNKFTRREFLKKSAGTAGAVIISGIGSGCSSIIPKIDSSGREESSAPDGRHSYKTFSEGQIGNLKIKNRLARSATMISGASGGVPKNDYINAYKQLAEGGIGLIITGFMIPTKEDARYPTQVSVYDDRHINGLKNLADAVHNSDKRCKILAQIGHSGASEGPSGISFPWKGEQRTLTSQEIGNIVSDFSDAILRVKKSGFDGAELHGAHAYLLSTFLSPFTNKRTDRYGGSLKKRTRIIREIMEQARKKVGPDFPILIKLNSDDNVPGGITPENFPELAREIANTGVDAIDVSGNDCLQMDIDSIDDETYFLKGAELLDVNVPIIVTGGNRTVEHMEKILNTGEVDFFGLARPLIREPDLPDRWREGRGGASATCISCNGCFGVIMRGEQTYCVQET